ncbi:MAG: hypothetical protein U1F60_00250 [Planctomycetota bacterium]
MQSLSQIHALYGNEAGAVLVGFSSKVFFPNVEWTDAEFVSLASGTMTVQAPSEPGVPPVFLSRRVYLPEEVARPRAHPVLGRPVTMMLADGPPLQAYLARAHATEPLRTLLLERGKKRTRPRRKHPLRYERDDAVVVEPPKFTDTRSATDTLIQRWLAEAERRWALPSAPRCARNDSGSGCAAPACATARSRCASSRSCCTVRPRRTTCSKPSSAVAPQHRACC